MVDVHVEATGPDDAPVVVLSGSLGSTLAMWDPQVPALAERFRVVRYDHRGHGKSPVPPGPYELADLGEDVVALLDRLGVARAHFAGLSLGGFVGMWLAAHRPERVDRLALMCTSAFMGPPGNWAARAATVRAEGTVAISETVVSRWLTSSFAAANPAAVTYLQEMVTATPDTGYAECCGAIERMDLTGDLASITAPTLVIAGTEDPATPPEHAERIVAGVRDARLAVLGPAAHLASFERADLVNPLLLAHFAGDGGSGGGTA